MYASLQACAFRHTHTHTQNEGHCDGCYSSMAVSVKSLATWSKQSIMSVCHSMKLIIPGSVIMIRINYSDHVA